MKLSDGVGRPHLSHQGETIMRHLKLRASATSTGVLCPVGLLFAGAATAYADTDPDPDADTINPGESTTRGEGETIDDIDLPDDWVETVPDDLANMPEREPDSGIAFTVGTGTDGHYCGSNYIKAHQLHVQLRRRPRLNPHPHPSHPPLPLSRRVDVDSGRIGVERGAELHAQRRTPRRPRQVLERHEATVSVPRRGGVD
ncbi:MAG: hypothetical protein F4076_07060 [Acidimicrobiaceae bacterium]|nr:hypothetical protein [Acidimicrobiaceae bacterium]